LKEEYLDVHISAWMEKKSIYLLWAIVCRVVELDGYTAGRVLHINGDMFWAVSDSCVVFPAVHQTKPIACRSARHSGYSGGGEILSLFILAGRLYTSQPWVFLLLVSLADWAFVFLDAHHFLRPLCVCAVDVGVYIWFFRH
jgi:hypothetical protein